MANIMPFLWFNKEAEDAVKFYTSVFKNSKTVKISRYGKEGFDVHGMPEGTVMTIQFKINGQDFMALNGGPIFKFTEAISFVINCANQKEIDYYWEKLSEGGDEKAQMCGWLKDKYGLSWQIIPNNLSKMMQSENSSQTVMKVFMKMKKINMADLEKAYKG